MTVDLIRMPPLPERLRDAIADALRGASPAAPDLSPDDLEALDEHGLVPLLHHAARWPALRERAIACAAEEAFRLRDLQEVLRALDARGVAPLILKGTALAYQIYPAPETRPRTDTDLLVRGADLEAVRETMASLGFNERPTSGDELGVRQHAFFRSNPPGIEHVYDVHTAIANSAVFADLLRYDELFARSVAIPTLGPHARGLAAVDALLLAVIHRVAHHYDSDRLIWLCDVHRLRERMADAEHAAFWRAAAERRVVTISSRAVALAGEWFGDALGHRAEDHLGRDAIERHEPSRAFLDRSRSRGALLAGDLAALPRWQDRAVRLWQLAFPPVEFMRATFGSAAPLAYVRRAVRGMARLFRRVA